MTNYDDTTITPPHHWLFKAATFCGLIPLLSGNLDFVVWIITGEVAMAAIGMLIAIFGTVLVMLGTVLLLIYSSLTKLPLSALKLPLAVMYVNFPIAAVYIAIGYQFYVR